MDSSNPSIEHAEGRGRLERFLLREPTWVLGLAVLAFLLLGFVAPPVMVELASDPETLDAENGIRATLLGALGGLGVLAFGYYTVRTYALNNRAKAEERDREVAERIITSAGLLSDPSEYVRLSAIAALDRIGRVSPEDREQVVEILSSYLRQLEPATNGGGPRPEARLIAKALVGLRPRDAESEAATPLDLDGAHLVSIDLSGASLRGARLTRANLARVDLRDCDLRGADLSYANVSRADLRGASLEGARIVHAQGWDTATREEPTA